MGYNDDRTNNLIADNVVLAKQVARLGRDLLCLRMTCQIIVNFINTGNRISLKTISETLQEGIDSLDQEEREDE